MSAATEGLSRDPQTERLEAALCEAVERRVRLGARLQAGMMAGDFSDYGQAARAEMDALHRYHDAVIAQVRGRLAARHA